MGLFKKKEEKNQEINGYPQQFSSQIPSLNLLPSSPKDSSTELDQTLIKSSLEEKNPTKTMEDYYSRFKPKNEDDYQEQQITTNSQTNTTIKEAPNKMSESIAQIPIMQQPSTINTPTNIPSKETQNKMLESVSQMPTMQQQQIKIIAGPDSIFIKIEKVKEAKKEAMKIKEELEEINALIKKINEINKEEESEMKEINVCFDSIKKRFYQIEDLLFEKI